MLPRLEMSRDECRKCLRCLELDAYANMVSVLRAQGPFTADKRSLLQELANVLHISNERHRAEIRRAVNDDKLSIIAEQLSGPNTGTDWAIEGRRTIPLLPRLKAHNAFTTLANSLSIVTAIANERQPRLREKLKPVKVKVETDGYSDLQTAEKSHVILHSDGLNNKKRKRTMLEISDNESNDYVHEVRKRNNSVKYKMPENEVLSTLPVQHSEVLPVSCTPSVDTLQSNQNFEKNAQDITCLPSFENALQKKSVTVVSVGVNSTGSSTSVSVKNLNPQPIACNNGKVKICRPVSSSVPINLQNTVKNKPKLMSIQPSHSVKSATTSMSYNVAQGVCDNGTELEFKGVNINNEKGLKFISVHNKNKQKIIKPDMNCSTQSVKTISMLTQPVTTSIEKGLQNSDIQTISTSSPCVTSSGPGPPCDAKISKATLIRKSFPSVKLNALPSTKMPGARLTKGNVIVLQKGPLREITLSHGGKEVLGKVIMGGKNLCLTNQQNLNSITFLPHRVSSCNGDQTIKMVSATNYTSLESAKSNVKTNNNVVLDIHQDTSENNNGRTQFNETSNTFTANFQDTLVNQNSKFTAQEKSNDSTNSCIEHVVEDVDTLEPQEHGSQDIYEDEFSNKSESCGAMEAEVKNKILYHDEAQTTVMEGILDPQTGICNFQPTDENISNIRMAELSHSGLGMFTSSLTSTDINLENYSYMETNDTSNILDATENSMLITDELDELKGS